MPTRAIKKVLTMVSATVRSAEKVMRSVAQIAVIAGHGLMQVLYEGCSGKIFD